MNGFRCRTADELLSAYYADRHEPVPAERACAWLRSFVCRHRLDSESFNYAGEVIDSAVLDVEDLAQNFLGLDLFIDDLSPFDADAGAPVFGLVVPETGSIKVCLRAADYLPLYRSTVAHEIAHVVLQHGKRHRTMCYSPNAARRPAEEREADRFMANALLPKPLLYLAIVFAGRAQGLEPGEAFRGANTERGRYQWRHIYFPFFLDRLRLSRELVTVRMSQHGFFDDSTSAYHRTYPIPNRWRKPAPLQFASVIERALPRRNTLFERLAECWCALIPETLNDHCALESFVGGTLTVRVDSPPHLYEIKQLLLSGIEQELVRAAKSTGLKKIQLRPGRH